MLRKITVGLVFSLSLSFGIAAYAAAGGVSGKVVESMDAGGYTYLKIKGAAGETWAAVPKTVVKSGTEVTIDNPMVMDGFESKTLKRKFDHIIFGTLAAGGAAAAPASHAGMPGIPKVGAGANAPMGGMGSMNMGMGHGGAIPQDSAPIKVAKAEGKDGRTVSELFAQKATFKDKSVAVRGKVVKVSTAILGKNWLHIQDGTGSKATNDFDLVVTTTDQVKPGDIVLAKGTVHLNRDLGAGYKYALLVEDAKVSK